MTNKMIQEIIDYLESGEKFVDILIKELDRTDLSGLEKRRYSSLLDALMGPDELYCAMNDWPDNVSFKIVSKEEHQEDEIILHRGPITMDAVTKVSDYVRELPLTNEQNDKLIKLMCKQLVAVEHESFMQGFKVCMDTVLNEGLKGLEDKVLKISRIENDLKIEDSGERERTGLIFHPVYGKEDLKKLKDCTVYLIEDVENKEENFYGTEITFHNKKNGKYIGLLKDNDGQLSMSQWF